MTQSTVLSKRSPEEIFMYHAQALGAEDVDGTALDYSDGACLITQDGVMRGFFTAVFQTVPRAQWYVKTIYVDNVLFLQLSADSRLGSISDGVSTFIFADGLIQLQMARYTLVPKG